MNKVILVVLDGLAFSVGRECMGFTMAQVERGLGNLLCVQSELPSMSRPLYECLLTGKSPSESGIYHNDVVRLSKNDSIFSLCREQGKVTAASAYHWMSELYNRAPWDNVRDRFTNDESLNIAHGIFYEWDHYEDAAVIHDGEYLRRTYSPDFLLIHPMNIDDTGHRFGVNSSQYRNQTRKVDIHLSHHLSAWLNDGYHVIITADHGMNDDKSHGGVTDIERDVPFYFFGPRFNLECSAIKQTQIAGTICQLLGLNHSLPYCKEMLKNV